MSLLEDDVLRGCIEMSLFGTWAIVLFSFFLLIWNRVKMDKRDGNGDSRIENRDGDED